MATFDSFAMHCRVLIDFLWGKRQRPEHWIGDDYFPGTGGWKSIRPTKPPLLGRTIRRASAEVAHLSDERTAPSLEWPYEDLWLALADVLDKFIENAHRIRLGDEAYGTIKNLIADAAPSFRPWTVAEALASATTGPPQNDVTIPPVPGTAILPVSPRHVASDGTP